MRHVRRLALITPPVVLLTRTPYAVVMSPFEKITHSGKPTEDLKTESDAKNPPRPCQAKEKGLLDKLKAFQLHHHRRNARDESIVFSKVRPPSSAKILQAYEDLQQTIERIRVRNTSPVSPTVDDIVSEDDLIAEREKCHSIKYS